MKEMKYILKNIGVQSLKVAAGAFIISSPAIASDIEIYKTGAKGNVVITLMLDTSGSMDTVDPTKNCKKGYVYTSFLEKKDYTYSKDGKSFTTSVNVEGCQTDGVPNRISNLKTGIVSLLTDPDKLDDNVAIGLGYYSSKQNGKTGTILIPAKKLDFDHRKALAETIRDLVTGNATPTANAYAEVGAYMMGTATSNVGNEETRTLEMGKAFQGKDGYWRLYKCNYRASTHTQYNIGSWYGCIFGTDYYGNPLTYQNFPPVDTKSSRSALDLTKIGVTSSTKLNALNFYKQSWYGEKIKSKWGSNPDSGMGFSSKDTKNSDQTKYVSPIADNTKECDGNGIYFLTDGKPNNSSEARAAKVMDFALENKLTTSCSNELFDPVYGTYKVAPTAWQCIGDFAKNLRDTKNPKGAEIKTAVVGYGSVFSSAQQRVNVDGKSYANCNTIPDSEPSAKNACNWGAKTYKGDDAGVKKQLKGVGGYGEGGFYYAADGDAVAKSIVDFADSLSEPLKPLSAGTISSPADDLDPSSFSLIAYLPIVEPKPESNDLVWPGNLKKYRIKKGALVGKDGEPLYTVKKDLNPDTLDLWNKTGKADLGLSQVGGTYDRVFNKESDIKTRKVVTNNNAGLRKLSVNDKGEPVGFKAIGKLKINNKQRRQLIHYMGYPVDLNKEDLPSPLTKTLPDGSKEAVSFNPANKVLGGVLHSNPQVVSQSATYNKAKKEFENRKDYILYGSMEGALHIVDKATGNEKLTFVPKEVLQKQGEALTVGAKGNVGKPVYGVDGEWTVHSKYQFNAAGSRVTATKLYAFGGLRMGGDSMYGLNIKNINNPKLLFHVSRSRTTYKADGSVRQSLTTGFKNDKPAPGYARMGQSWSKPVITSVWHKGQRVLVAVFGGGYDIRYEDPYFDPADATEASKKKALGNAVYIVAAEANTKAGIKAGDLIGWVSSDATKHGISRYKVNNMNHSIVAEPRILDRNNDGMADHIYIGDLGGQVFRIDIQNKVGNEAANFHIKRAVRVLDATGDSGEGSPKKDKAPRFYERPTVTFHRMGGLIQAMVTIGSGDRSTPKHERSEANRVYVLKDQDISRRKLYDNTYSIVTKDISIKGGGIAGVNADELADLDYATNRETIKQKIVTGEVAGWFVNFNEFDDNKDAKGLKMFNKPIAVANNLYVTVYSPTSKKSPNECEVGIVGETEIRQYCLPYGACYQRVDGKLKVLNKDSKLLEPTKLCKGICGIGGGGNDSIGDPSPPPTGDPNPQPGEYTKTKSILLGQKCDGLYADLETIDVGLKCENTSNALQPIEWFERRGQ